MVSGKKKNVVSTCSVHSVHSSFLKGIDEYGSNTSDFILSMYNCFSDWP